jgi:hypothetical protein
MNRPTRPPPGQVLSSPERRSVAVRVRCGADGFVSSAVSHSTAGRGAVRSLVSNGSRASYLLRLSLVHKPSPPLIQLPAASCLLGMELSGHGALRMRSKLEEASSHVNPISTAEVRKVVDALQTSCADLHRSVEDPLPATKAAADEVLATRPRNRRRNPKPAAFAAPGPRAAAAQAASPRVAPSSPPARRCR